MAEAITVIIASWFTHSSLFIFVNLVIGTIAITSRFTNTPQTHPQLARSPSLLQRLRSFKLAQYNCNYEPAEAESTHHQPQLVRSPSLLERVRSFRLGHNYDEPTAVLEETESTQPQLVRTTSLLERVRSFKFGLHHTDETEHVQPKSEDPNPRSPRKPQLNRAPSILQRLQSMNFSRLDRSDSVHLGDEGSRPETDDSDPGGKEVGEMRKSASESVIGKKLEWEEDEEAVEKRRPATARCETTAAGEDEEVDAKADDFINKFKKQLRLQRVDSILRYRGMVSGN